MCGANCGWRGRWRREVVVGLTSPMDLAQADGQNDDKQKKEPSQCQAPILYVLCRMKKCM